MKINLTPKERQLLRFAIGTELREQRNNLSNHSGMDDDEIEEAEKELEEIEKSYAKLIEKLPLPASMMEGVD